MQPSNTNTLEMWNRFDSSLITLNNALCNMGTEKAIMIVKRPPASHKTMHDDDCDLEVMQSVRQLFFCSLIRRIGGRIVMFGK